MQAVFVHHHHAAGAHHGAGPGQGVEIHRGIQKVGGQTAPRRPADLHRLELLLVGNAAADVENQLPQGHPHGDLHQSRMGHVAHHGKNRRTRTVGTDAPEPVGPFFHDGRHRGQGLDIVDHRGPTVETPLHRIGRAVPGHAAVAFHRPDQGRLFTADEGAGPLEQVDVEIQPAAQDIGAQQALFPGLFDGGGQNPHRQGILGPHIKQARAAPTAWRR
jgi:hypothetical protein